MNNQWPVISLSSVDSTNNYANSLVFKNEIVTETVITAYVQQQGRGQQGNSWFSEPGKNLTFSLVTFPKFLLIEKQFHLSQSISLALISFLHKHKILAKVKWPNDIYVDNKKIAGILIENAIMNQSLLHSVIGIGLNVNQDTFTPASLNAVSMKNITGHTYELNTLLNELITFLQSRFEELKQGKYEEIKTNYINNLYRYNEMRKFHTDSNSFEGKIIDVLATGELVILSDDGKVSKFMFKEVQFAD